MTEHAFDAADPYGFPRPDLAEAHAALTRLYGGAAAGLWADLLRDAGLTGHETDPASFDRLVATMLAADPVTGLCGRALAIRAATYAHLAAASGILRAAA
ncbi:hypothetical protein GCM10010123_07260 [Pilimelia anulata]|uniref:Uncharacterized protein n=1 Tax=Pilimelia anulata TaxID=53371 RepID=A0A8J3F6G0_9ACTN|nr:hypothetical protein [Pilimelia anulata]GGJ79949.1 hypothetical protein GCM10010123_07260 [Pilimelia anulata]